MCGCTWGLPFYRIHLHVSKPSYFSYSQRFSFEFIIYLREAAILTLNSISSLACPSSSIGSVCHLLHLWTVMHIKLSTTPIKWASLYLHFSTYSNLFSTFQQEWIFLDLQSDHLVTLLAVLRRPISQEQHLNAIECMATGLPWCGCLTTIPKCSPYVTFPLAKSALHALPWWEDTQASPVVCPVPHVHLPLLNLPLKEALSITPLMKHCHLLGHLCSPHRGVCSPFCTHCDARNITPATAGSLTVCCLFLWCAREHRGLAFVCWCQRIHTEQMMTGKMKELISPYTLASTKLSTCQCGKVEKTKAETKMQKRKYTFIKLLTNR